MRRVSKVVSAVALCAFVFTTTLSAHAEEKAILKLTMDEAIQKGLESSIALKQVENEIDLAELSEDRARFQARKLRKSKENLKDAKSELNRAESLFSQGKAPSDIALPNGQIIPAGTDIDSIPGLPGEVKEQIKGNIRSTLDSQRQLLLEGRTSMIDALQQAGGVIGGKLNFNSLTQMGINSTADLLETMSGVALEVTQASYDIYKNQVAMLIQKNYYDVLQAQKILEVKKRAMDRAQKQYELVKASYEEGLKSKDDMLLASIYYKGTQIEYQKAKGELQNALIELKRTMNLPMESEIELTDVLAEQPDSHDLEKGIESGLTNRLEMKKAIGEVIVYTLNFEIVSSEQPKSTYQYQEAELLMNKAKLAYDQAKVDVEASIRQSYETLISTAKMLEASKKMVEEAQESLQIAEYKYMEGYGVETGLLKKLGIESSAGTIVEVLAAEENLADLEEKTAKIIYGYNLARIKYLNDIGYFIY